MKLQSAEGSTRFGSLFLEKLQVFQCEKTAAIISLFLSQLQLSLSKNAFASVAVPGFQPRE